MEPSSDDLIEQLNVKIGSSDSRETQLEVTTMPPI